MFLYLGERRIQLFNSITIIAVYGAVMGAVLKKRPLALRELSGSLKSVGIRLLDEACNSICHVIAGGPFLSVLGLHSFISCFTVFCR